MSEAMEWVKAHPKTTAAIVFGVGALVILVWMSSGSSNNSAANASAAQYAAQQQAAAEAAASGNQLAELQAGLQASAGQTQAASADNANNDASQVAIAQIAASTAGNAATLAAQAAEATAQYSAQATEVTSTVSAQAVETQSNNSEMQNLFDTIIAAGTQQSNLLASVGADTTITTGYISPIQGGGWNFGVSTIPNADLYTNGPNGGALFQAPTVAQLGAAPAPINGPMLDAPASSTEHATQAA